MNTETMNTETMNTETMNTQALCPRPPSVTVSERIAFVRNLVADTVEKLSLNSGMPVRRSLIVDYIEKTEPRLHGEKLALTVKQIDHALQASRRGGRLTYSARGGWAK